MCDTCGCGMPGEGVRIIKPGEHKDEQTPGHLHTYSHKHAHTHEGQEHDHVHTHSYHHEHDGSHQHDTDDPDSHDHDGEHSHDHPHYHEHDHKDEHPDDDSRVIRVEQDALARNQLLAERNRGYFEALDILALNLVSSPGSGKTSLIERTIREMKDLYLFFIIEGDQQTTIDADRIHATGAPVIQVNTGQGCHLDADMVNRAFRELDLTQQAILMIENVGNLVCPALFDLGESRRVVIMSVTEGEDKPVKYPFIFRSSGLCIINKTDLLPYLDFDLDKAREYAKMVNPDIEIIELSVKTGEGMDLWYEWLKKEKKSAL